MRWAQAQSKNFIYSQVEKVRKNLLFAKQVYIDFLVLYNILKKIIKFNCIDWI